MARDDRPAAPKGAPYHHGDLRAALLTAAETVLAERGLDGFTLRECARRAGVSHAAPAHHFGDVGGLLAEMAKIGFERLHAAMASEMAASPDDPVARLAAAGRGYLSFARDNPQHFLLMFQADRLDQTHPGLAEAGAAAFGDLVGAVAALRGLADPLADPDGRIDIMLAWSVVHGFASLALAGRLDPFDPAGGFALGPLAIGRWTGMLAGAPEPPQLSRGPSSAST
jgi:AcrR family transcriptional regulator